MNQDVSRNSWLILRRRKPMLGGVLLPTYLSSVGKHFARSGDRRKTERARDAGTSWNAKPVSIDLARMLPYWCIRLAPTKLILRYSLRTDTRASLFAFVPYMRAFKRDADNWFAVRKQPRYQVSVKIRRCSVPCILWQERSTRVSFCL